MWRRSCGQGNCIHLHVHRSEWAKWQLSLYDTATKTIVRVVRVKLSSGLEWNPDADTIKGVSVEMAK